MDNDEVWVQYYIVNMDLQMSRGKIAAQCAHGATYYVMAIMNKREKFINTDIEISSMRRFNEWANQGMRKVILQGDTKAIQKATQSLLETYLVIDEGRTEVDNGSRTVVTFAPLLKSCSPSWLKRLQVLKEKS